MIEPRQVSRTYDSIDSSQEAENLGNEIAIFLLRKSKRPNEPRLMSRTNEMSEPIKTSRTIIENEPLVLNRTYSKSESAVSSKPCY